MRAIYKRELRSYFHSMIGYVFIAFLVAYTGIYFLAYNLNYGYPYFSYVLSGIPGSNSDPDDALLCRR